MVGAAKCGCLCGRWIADGVAEAALSTMASKLWLCSLPYDRRRPQRESSEGSNAVSVAAVAVASDVAAADLTDGAGAVS